jgi:hypothetical protein
MTEEDVEAVYLRERLRELEEEGVGTGTGDSGTADTGTADTGTPGTDGSTGNLAPSGKPPLGERLRSYLEKARTRAASTASSTGSGMSIVSTGSGMNNLECNRDTDNITASIRVIRKKMLEVSGHTGDTSHISPAIRFTGPCGGEWGEPYWTKKDFGRKKIISLSFDPTTGNCGVCDGEHLVRGSSGGGGGRLLTCS